MRLEKKLLLYTFSLLLFATIGCSKKTVVSSSSAEYREDLSAVRPRFEYIEPAIEKETETKSAPVTNAPKKGNEKPLYVNERLETVLDTMSKQNKSIRYISGYRIHVGCHVQNYFLDFVPYWLGNLFKTPKTISA